MTPYTEEERDLIRRSKELVLELNDRVSTLSMDDCEAAIRMTMAAKGYGKGTLSGDKYITACKEFLSYFKK